MIQLILGILLVVILIALAGKLLKLCLIIVQLIFGVAFFAVSGPPIALGWLTHFSLNVFSVVRVHRIVFVALSLVLFYFGFNGENIFGGDISLGFDQWKFIVSGAVYLIGSAYFGEINKILSRTLDVPFVHNKCKEALFVFYASFYCYIFSVFLYHVTDFFGWSSGYNWYAEIGYWSVGLFMQLYSIFVVSELSRIGVRTEEVLSRSNAINIFSLTASARNDMAFFDFSNVENIVRGILAKKIKEHLLVEVDVRVIPLKSMILEAR
ncbi:MAG: hypothetical protein U5M23_01495 [Marinagarivorans sp.]|nr:hypothetical protein [Marinagarivorans sp.]